MAQEFDFDIGKVVGPKGDTGKGIASIELLSTSGLNKTYRITMTDDTTFDFMVTDGNGISGATFDAQTNELTLTFQNGTTFTTPSLKGTKGDTGNGISRIEKTGTEDLVDTYTVTYTDGQTFSYTVTNGADGVSPEVTVTQISGGHTVEIEDADGVKTFDVLDGEVTEARLAEALATKAPVILNTASGAIASFDDGADSMPIKKLVAQIEPVQDLHGYDNPWPAGGGKNLFNESTLFDAASYPNAGAYGYYYADNLVLKPNTAYTISAIKTGIEPGNNIIYYCATVSGSGQCYIINNGNAGVSGILITGEDGLIKIGIKKGDASTIQDALNLLKNNVKFQLEEGSIATAYAPYSNICPISGWTGAEIQQTGKNLLSSRNYYDSNTITENADGSITLRNTGYNQIYFSIYLKAGTYTFSADVIDGGGINRIINLDISNYPLIVSSNKENDKNIGTFTLTTSCNVGFRKAENGASTIKNYQLELASYVSAYEPCSAKTISVNWEDEAGTVYGGTLTLNPDRTGTLVVDKGTIDLGTITWVKTVNTSGQFYSETNFGASSSTDILCSEFRYGRAYAAAEDNVIELRVGTYHRTWVRSTPYSGMTAAEFKAAMTGVQLVYPLASPQTFQLTAEQVSGILITLYGINNIWADTGDVEVTYPADTKLYIEKLTQPTEDDMTADHAISAGTFFMIGNNLYLATSQIAAGGTITPGTNATKLSLADALNTLNT